MFHLIPDEEAEIDFVGAGVIVSGAMELSGGYRDSVPLGDRRL